MPASSSQTRESPVAELLVAFLDLMTHLDFALDLNRKTITLHFTEIDKTVNNEEV